MPGKVFFSGERAECCKLFKLFLQRCGYKVMTVHNGTSCAVSLADLLQK